MSEYLFEAFVALYTIVKFQNDQESTLLPEQDLV